MVSQKEIRKVKRSLIGGGVVPHKVKAYPCGNSARSASLCSQQKANIAQTNAIKASHAGGKKRRKHKTQKHKARKNKLHKRKTRKHKARKHKTRKHKARKHKTRRHRRTKYGGAQTATVPSFPGCSKSHGVNNACTASKNGNQTGWNAQVEASGDKGAFAPIVQPKIKGQGGGMSRKEWHNTFTFGPLKEMTGGRSNVRFEFDPSYSAGSRERD